MADFSTNIQQFQQNGTYEYKFDEGGNLIFNSSSADFSQVFLSFPLTNVMYNNSKIASFYTTEFEEFVPITVSTEVTSSNSDLQQQLNIISAENDSLKSQLNDVIESTTAETSGPNQEAIKQVILELRKALGEGRVDSDFSEDFPYTSVFKPLPST